MVRRIRMKCNGSLEALTSQVLSTSSASSALKLSHPAEFAASPANSRNASRLAGRLAARFVAPGTTVK